MLDKRAKWECSSLWSHSSTAATFISKNRYLNLNAEFVGNVAACKEEDTSRGAYLWRYSRCVQLGEDLRTDPERPSCLRPLCRNLEI